jgi:hypothetical protein
LLWRPQRDSKDDFAVDFGTGALGEKDRRLVLAAAFDIDLLYFENKASSRPTLPSIDFD